jgi:hypothetical protein
MKQCVYSGWPQNEAGWQVLLTLTSPTQSIPNRLREESTMQDNPNTINLNSIQGPLVDTDLWEQAFEPFEGEHYAALRLGFNFAMLRKYLDGQLIKFLPVIDSLELAMAVIFKYTEFHDASFDLFIRLTEGDLTHDEEQMLNALGIKF